MSESSDQTRRWSTLPPGSMPARGEWRRLPDSDNGTSAASLRLQRTIYGFVVFCLAAVVGWLAWLVLNQPARTGILPIGISFYSQEGIPPNEFGQEDADRFTTLGAESWDFSNNLRGQELLDRLNAPQVGRGGNLLVFVSLHAVVKNAGGEPQLYFVALDADPEGLYTGGSALVPARDFLQTLLKKDAGEILLLVDAGRVTADWRNGIFGNDAPELLKKQVEAIAGEEGDGSNGRLQVICSTASHETSWADPAANQSVFTRYAIEGLTGNADKREFGGNADDRVGSNELFQYVKTHVADWARQNRGAVQTVQRFGAETDFDILLAQQEPDEEDAAEISESAAEEEKKSAEKSGSESEETASDPEKTKTSDEPAEDISASSGDESEEVSSVQLQQQRADELHSRLAELWKSRDDLRRGRQAALLAPHHWRALQERLSRAERVLGFTATKLHSDGRNTTDQSRRFLDEHLNRAARLLEDAENLRAEIENRVLRNGIIVGSSRTTGALPEELSRLSVGWPVPRPEEKTAGADAEQTPDEPGFSELAAAFLDAPPDAAEEPAKKLEEFLAGDPAAAAEGFGRIIERAEAMLTGGDRAGVERLRRLLAILETSGGAGTIRWPAEMRLLEQIIEAERGFNETGDSPDEFLRAAGRALRLRTAFEKQIAGSPYASSLMRPQVEAALRTTTAAEGWLLEAGHQPHGLRRAEEALDVAAGLIAGEDEATGADSLEQKTLRLNELLLLRAQLYAELPAYARWVAGRAARRASAEDDLEELAGWIKRRGPGDAATAGLRLEISGSKPLLELITGLQGLENELREIESGGGVSPNLGKTLTDLQGSFQELRRVFQAEVDQFAGEAKSSITGDEWRRITGLLEVPWIDADQREALRRLRNVEVQTFGTPEKPTASAPLWQGFWAMMTLELAGPHPTTGSDLDQEWTRWQSAGVDGRLARQAGFGQRVNETWSAIADYAWVGGEAGPELDARSADGWDPVRAASADPVIASRTDRFLELMALRRDLWNEHLPSFRSVSDGYADVVRQLGGAPAASRSRPNLQAAVSELFFGLTPQERRKNLPLTVDLGTAAQAENWQLQFLPADVEVFREGRPVRGGDPITGMSGGSGTLSYEVQLAEDQVLEQTLTVALLRAEKNAPLPCPVSIQNVTLIPRADPNRWAVRFLAADETRRDPRRNSTDRENNRTTFLLPPATGGVGMPPKPYSLIPHLTYPAGFAGQTVRVAVYHRDPDEAGGGPNEPHPHTGEPIGTANVSLPRQAGPHGVPLNFQLPQAAPPEAGAAGGSSAAGADRPDQPKPVTAGFVFEIVPENRDPILHTVIPDIWPPSEFIEEPRLDLTQQDRIALDILWKPAGDRDLLLSGDSATLTARLHFPEGLAERAPGLRVDIPPGGRGKVFADIDEAQLREAGLLTRSFPVLLSLSGWPRSYHWKVKYNRGQNRFVPDTREDLAIAVLSKDQTPPTAAGGEANGERLQLGRYAAVKPGTDVTFLLLPHQDILSGIGDETQAGTAGHRPQGGRVVRLSGRLVEDRSDTQLGAVGPPRTIRGRFDEQVTLVSIASGTWQFLPRVQNHAFPFRPGGEGRFRFEAQVTPAGAPAATATKLFIADETPPRSRDLSVDFGGNVVQNGFELTKNTLQIRVRATDAQSGIAKVEAGLDINGDGQLNDDEPHSEPVVAEDPLAGSRQDFTGTLQIPLPDSLRTSKEEQRYHVLVRATNGMKLSETAKFPSSNEKLLFRPPPPPPGSITILVKKKRRVRQFQWRLEALSPGLSSTQYRTVTGSPSQDEKINVPNLKPGQYRLRVKHNVGEETAEFTLPAGKTNQEVSIELD